MFIFILVAGISSPCNSPETSNTLNSAHTPAQQYTAPDSPSVTDCNKKIGSCPLSSAHNEIFTEHLKSATAGVLSAALTPEKYPACEP